jgi:hypothetical protein
LGRLRRCQAVLDAELGAKLGSDAGECRIIR